MRYDSIARGPGAHLPLPPPPHPAIRHMTIPPSSPCRGRLSNSSSSEEAAFFVPRNPFLSTGAYPISHANTFASDGVPYRSIERAEDVVQDHMVDDRE
jgi:hypothetical protein